MIQHIRQNRFGDVESTQVGSANPCGLLSRLGTFGLPFVFIDGSQNFKTAEKVEKWVDEWFSSKSHEFFCRGIHKLTEIWSKCVASNGKYFE